MSTYADADENMSGAEIEFSIVDAESSAQEEDEERRTETEEPPAATAAATPRPSRTEG